MNMIYGVGETMY